MERRVFEGTLFMLFELENYVVLLTNKDADTVLKNAGDNCEEFDDGIVCSGLRYDIINAMGIRLDRALRKFHGKEVRIKIEVIE